MYIYLFTYLSILWKLKYSYLSSNFGWDFSKEIGENIFFDHVHVSKTFLVKKLPLSKTFCIYNWHFLSRFFPRPWKRGQKSIGTVHNTVTRTPSSRTALHAWKNISGMRTHCLCSVHEDRVDKDRRESGQTCKGGEVAGLDDVDDSCTATVTSSVPGADGIRSHRRNRPLSLAVQPLNYHRLDPDHKTVAEIAVRHHHPNMTSQESIGSCSLDVDRSASDRSGWLYRHYCERPSLGSTQVSRIEHTIKNPANFRKLLVH